MANLRKEKRKLYVTHKQGEYLLEQAKKDEKSLFIDFESSNYGLRDEQIKDKQDKYGLNTIVSKNKTT